MNINILLAEDDKNISKVIKAYLDKEGYNCITAFDGLEAIDIFNSKKIDLIILDLMMPKLSGEKVIEKIRLKSNVPVIMLTAKISLENKIDGFNLGADDYVTKPFDTKELILRVKALLNRTYGDSINNMVNVHDDIYLYKNEMIVKKNNTILDFTTNEFKILLTFINNPNQSLTRDQIINLTFGSQYDGYDRTIDTYIKNIRQKIELDSKNPKIITTVYGIGYKYNK